MIYNSLNDFHNWIDFKCQKFVYDYKESILKAQQNYRLYFNELSISVLKKMSINTLKQSKAVCNVPSSYDQYKKKQNQ